MTTSSGKPPVDEQLTDAGFRAGADRANERVGHDREHGGDAPPIYGAGVPYGGDDRTEEIEPIALDASFTPAMAPKVAPTAQADTKQRLEQPQTQLALSDLFDSTPPPPGSMEPPELEAFTSARSTPAPAAKSLFGRDPSPPTPRVANTPARGSAPAQPRPTPPSSPAVMAAPSRPSSPPPPVMGSGSFPYAAPAAPSAPFASPALDVAPATNSVQALPSIDVLAPKPAASPDVAASSPGAQDHLEPPARRSVPTLESFGNAASRSAAARHEALHGPSVDNVVPRFPSDVPTSRPPDVMLVPSGNGSTAAPHRPSPRGPQSSIAAPVPAMNKNQQLPSIMLAADVEADRDQATTRAMRAARATVRIELPPNLGRPGSPLPPRPAAAVGSVPPVAELPRAAPLAGVPRIFLWGMAAVMLLAAAWLVLGPRTGSLVVTATGPGNRALPSVQIFVDDDPLCATSPCLIKGLSAGPHRLHAVAPGLASREPATIDIEAGEEAIFNIELISTAPEQKSGGLFVAAPAGKELTLYVDDKRMGKLPQSVSGLSAGKHWLRFDAEDGTPPIEKPVTIVAGQVANVDTAPAKRDKAQVTIRLSPGSEGAAVLLDDAFVLDFPAELELDPKVPHTLTASKPGFEDLSMPIEFAEGEMQKLVEVSLTPEDTAEAPRRAKPKAVRKPAAAKASAAPSADPTQGLLNISSVPPSQIILNGRPLGNTPKTGIAVPGDSLQTIVFVHPKMGRRRAQKFVPAGKERTVSIRF